ncbi:MAG: polysaccharide deacetylase family protein [Lachnospiraceae bacterium]|nr:polysaccharide deacetylase family protein [Lachnospiraceae bacterium]
MGWTEQYKKAVTFSYDDGVAQDLRLLEIFNRYGMKATFNLNTGLNAENGSWVYMGKEVKRLNLAEHIKTYEGHEIAVHTRTHPNLLEVDDVTFDREIREDAEEIERLFGRKPVGMAYPYGTYSDEIIAKLPAYGIQYSRSVWQNHDFALQDNLLAFRPTCHHDDEALFDLAERFLAMEPDTPQIFYIWGHAYEFDGKENWDRIEKLCQKLAGRNDIFYGTNAEVLL